MVVFGVPGMLRIAPPAHERNPADPGWPDFRILPGGATLQRLGGLGRMPG